MQPVTYHYDKVQFDFGTILRGIFDTDDLSTLRADTPLDVPAVQADHTTDFHARFYAAFDEQVRGLYRQFVAAFVPEILGTTKFCFQRVPTFRIQFQENVAVEEFHTDGDYHHSAGEVNFWVPFTSAWDSNSIWVEGELGSATYEAAKLDPGDVLVFDAVHWSHGNKINETGHTRVSFDFRCIALRDYSASTERTVDAGRGLWIGDYFDVL